MSESKVNPLPDLILDHKSMMADRSSLTTSPFIQHRSSSNKRASEHAAFSPSAFLCPVARHSASPPTRKEKLHLPGFPIVLLITEPGPFKMDEGPPNTEGGPLRTEDGPPMLPRTECWCPARTEPPNPKTELGAPLITEPGPRIECWPSTLPGAPRTEFGLPKPGWLKPPGAAEAGVWAPNSSKMSGGTAMEHVSSAPHGNEEQAITYLTQFVQSPVKNEEDIKKREDSIIELGSMLARNKRTHELRHMIEVTRPFLIELGKAKAAKMVELVEESIEWATGQNRNFLRQTLQARLVRLLNDLQRFPQALQNATELIRELKKVDDKDLIVEVQLEESKACYFLGSLAKARAALTSARTTANSMYIPRTFVFLLFSCIASFSAAMQAELDMQSGILHAADERDFQTAFSYFYEAFEGFDMVSKTKEATRALKYMLLCKVMLDTPEDISNITAHKHAIKYLGDDVTAMCAIGSAAKNRSLKEFNEAFGHYREELQCDPVVRKHFNALSDTMLEKELCRLIEPYSYVQISHVATAIGLSADKVEKKLAQMILDRKFYGEWRRLQRSHSVSARSGSLHQGDGMLIVYDPVPEEHTYDLSVQTIRAMGDVLDVLYNRAQAIR
ncbi:putative 26S proteasome regulatory subunit rpn-6.1 [Aphelenchoides fujianensis]|nr:putative 26S proteasome regulatory subunit rpn-6.1 [Aphelenchoides fujianensis]